MADIEMLGESEAVKARTFNLANNAGDIAARVIRDRLSLYGPEAPEEDRVITANHIERITDAEKRKAADKYTEERRLGLHNDVNSTYRGVTVIVLAHSREHIERTIGSDSQDLFGPSFEEQEGPNGLSLVKMRLPEGGFKQEQEGHSMTFYKTVETAENGIIYRVGGRFSLPTSYVLTIVSDAGEFWQNQHYSPDNTPHPINRVARGYVPPWLCSPGN